MSEAPDTGATVVGSVAGSTLAAARRGILGAHAGCGLIELRADRLTASEVEAAVRATARDLVVTVRHPAHGGTWDGSEEERVAVLRRALAAGARWIDVEVGTAAEALASEAPGRTILSDHATPCTPSAIRATALRLAASPATRLKLVPFARGLGEAGAVRHAYAAVAARRRLSAFAAGPGGTWTRVLCCSWGAWGTYGALDATSPTAAGQPSATELVEVYRAAEIDEGTVRYALVGADVSQSPSPAMHAAAYRAAGLDAIYLPLSVSDPDDALATLDDQEGIRAAAFGVTLPFKAVFANRCAAGDPIAAGAAAVNTVVGLPGARVGFNTDGPAAVRLLGGPAALAGARVAVAGAGGTARAVAVAASRAGARVTLFARRPAAVAEAARRAGADVAPWGELAGATWDALVNATPVGRSGERVVPAGSLRGRSVLDAVYGAVPTPLVADARARGLAVADGVSLLAEQGVDQFAAMTGHPAEPAAARAAIVQWLSTRSG